MDPPTMPGRSSLLHTGYPEEGGAVFRPGNPLSRPSKGLQTRETLCAMEDTSKEDSRTHIGPRHLDGEVCSTQDTRKSEGQMISPSYSKAQRGAADTRNPSDYGGNKQGVL